MKICHFKSRGEKVKNKYINIDDIDKEISKSYDLITTLEHKIVREKKRIEYLRALYFYIDHNGICPFTKRELLENDLKLQDYVLPILARINISERYDIGEMFKENAKLIIEKRQFAINELEKMKFKLKEKRCLINTAEHDYLQKFVCWYDICDLINKHINELKGEKCNEYK